MLNGGTMCIWRSTFLISLPLNLICLSLSIICSSASYLSWFTFSPVLIILYILFGLAFFSLCGLSLPKNTLAYINLYSYCVDISDEWNRCVPTPGTFTFWLVIWRGSGYSFFSFERMIWWCLPIEITYMCIIPVYIIILGQKGFLLSGVELIQNQTALSSFFSPLLL